MNSTTSSNNNKQLNKQKSKNNLLFDSNQINLNKIQTTKLINNEVTTKITTTKTGNYSPSSLSSNEDNGTTKINLLTPLINNNNNIEDINNNYAQKQVS